ncbi:unnamed protein product [Rotaria socialis]|uniref:Uncharacterized protein n=3 Tax=Rotaria socialis TaxID=392032 RepID=A0A820GT70_9BILA|nr:unnamed protein product [Rotaria socialis]
MNHSTLSMIINNLDPIFRRSTYRNRDVLIFESLDQISWIRMMMIILCITIGIGTFIDLIINYIKYRLILKQTTLHRLLVPVLLVLNILFHVAHYSHNIYNPAAYYEPKKLYLKIFFTEMEPTFLFNFPLSIVFVIASRKLLLSCTIGYNRSMAMPMIVTLYSLMSMVSGGHYTYEPFKNFPFICHMTIAGETIMAFFLSIIAWFIHLTTNTSKSTTFTYSRLTTQETAGSSIQRSMKKHRSLKHKSSDNTSLDDESS